MCIRDRVKEFKKDSIITPIFMILEVIMEMIIPLLMSSIIDDGVEKGDIHHIYIIGIWMVVACLLYTSYDTAENQFINEMEKLTG